MQYLIKIGYRIKNIKKKVKQTTMMKGKNILTQQLTLNAQETVLKQQLKYKL